MTLKTRLLNLNKSYISYSKWRIKVKSNSEMQLIEPCENCKKVKELEAEIKDLDAHVTWLENKAFEYEDEANRLRKQLNSLL